LRLNWRKRDRAGIYQSTQWMGQTTQLRLEPMLFSAKNQASVAKEANPLS